MKLAFLRRDILSCLVMEVLVCMICVMPTSLMIFEFPRIRDSDPKAIILFISVTNLSPYAVIWYYIIWHAKLTLLY